MDAARINMLTMGFRDQEQCRSTREEDKSLTPGGA